MRSLGALAVVGAGFALSACGDLLTESPPHIIVADNLYRDAAGFEAGVNALYGLVRREHEPIVGSGQAYKSPWEVGTDMVFGGSGVAGSFTNWGLEINPTLNYLILEWEWLYDIVNSANTIISRIEEPGVELTEAQKTHFLAQARFFRAYAYRHLTYLWGNVPLNLEESSGESVRTDWERTPVAQVREQMEEDWTFAAEHLPEVPPIPHSVTSAVARHYLAELYLARGEWPQAEQMAQSVINGPYSLVTQRYGVRRNEPGVPFMDMFYQGNINRHEGNTEILWAFQFEKDVPGGGEPIMRRIWLANYSALAGMAYGVEAGGRGIQQHKATRWALRNYEPQDDRGSYHAIRWFLLMNHAPSLPPGAELGDTIWLSTTTSERVGNINNWPWPRKYEWADPADVTGNYDHHTHTKLRLAQTYFLLAEAQFRQGKLAQAAQNLNAIRARANATPITAGQVTLDFILDEMARELQQEGERRYTLLRTGTWLERTRRHNTVTGRKIEPYNVLLPIPQAVIDANLGAPMPQNPGY